MARDGGRSPCHTLVYVTCAAMIIAAVAEAEPGSRQRRNVHGLHKQKKLLEEAKADCYQKMKSTPYPTEGLYCNRTFDNLLCWPDVPAGKVAKKKCPGYIFGFDDRAYAVRICHEDGSWGTQNGTNNSWTNFLMCPASPQKIPDYIGEHMGRWRLIYNIGYSISLVSLSFAIFIMLYFRKLHCRRNMVHNNLFFSSILRALSCVLRDNLLVEGLGFKWDLRQKEDGVLEFDPAGTHWQCKLLMSTFFYSLLANYMWILMEGLYLHTLLFCTVLKKKRFTGYIIFGWLFPLVIVVPWITLRITREDTHCWNTHQDPENFWILRGAIIVSIVINFGFFINIVRVLFMKLRASNTQDTKTYWRLVKSTLILIPLFGVHYIVFVTMPEEINNKDLHLIKVYAEHISSSFQGCVVAILFCFLNGEVRAEIKKKWIRHMQGRRGSSVQSRTLSTVSSFLLREKGTSQCTTVSDIHLPNSSVSRSSNIDLAVLNNLQRGNQNTDNKTRKKVHLTGGINGRTLEQLPMLNGKAHSIV